MQYLVSANNVAIGKYPGTTHTVDSQGPIFHQLTIFTLSVIYCYIHGLKCHLTTELPTFKKNLGVRFCRG